MLHRNTLIATVFVVTIASAFFSTAKIDAAQQRRPNIVLLVADDLGYKELGCYGQKYIKTPNIDKIAKDGMRFTDFYAGAPVCAPSRCVLMTGQHLGHSYIRNNGNPKGRKKDTKDTSGLPFFPGQNPIPDETVTMAEVLKAQGYKTAAIGKWGLGFEGSPGDPNRQGFDLFYGYYCQVHAHNHYPKYLWRNQEKVILKGNDRTLDGEQHSQDLFTKEALSFIRESKDEPFFLFMPFIIPHLSMQTTEKWRNQYKDVIPEAEHKHRGYLKHPLPRAGYAGMVSQMDDCVGQIQKLLAELKLTDDTLVIFTSDNGPTYGRLGGSDSDFFESAGIFRGLKGSVYEGGIRVPLVASWPGHIAPGSESNLPSAFYDLLPTLANVAEGKTPAKIDGISFLPTLLGQKDQQKHECLYWEFPGYGGQLAVRYGDWKGVWQGLSKKPDNKMELYNLRTDPGEKENVAAANPEIVKKIKAIVRREHTPRPIGRNFLPARLVGE